MARLQAPVSTRERIVEAALRLYSERGTIGASLRDVADAAGVTVPGLYYHFASKRDLIRAVYAVKGFEAVSQPLVSPDLSADVETRVVEQALRDFARMKTETEFLRLMVRESLRQDPDAVAVGTELRQATIKRWREVLAGAADIDSAADLEVAASCIRTFMWGLFVQYLTGTARSISGRIEAFARLIAPSLRSSPVTPR
jgi:AcrR family transcriptional regulator